MARAGELLELARARISSAEDRTREELVRYGQGRGQLASVLQSRDAEEDARLAYAETNAACHQLALRYRALAA